MGNKKNEEQSKIAVERGALEGGNGQEKVSERKENKIGDLLQKINSTLKSNQGYLEDMKKKSGVEAVDIDEARMVIWRANNALLELRGTLMTFTPGMLKDQKKAEMVIGIEDAVSANKQEIDEAKNVIREERKARREQAKSKTPASKDSGRVKNISATKEVEAGNRTIVANKKYAQGLVSSINELFEENKQFWDNDVDDEIEGNIDLLNGIENAETVEDQEEKIKILIEQLNYVKKIIGEKTKLENKPVLPQDVEGSDIEMSDEKIVKEIEGVKSKLTQLRRFLNRTESEKTKNNVKVKIAPLEDRLIILQSKISQMINRARKELDDLESLRGDDLEKYYWKKNITTDRKIFKSAYEKAQLSGTSIDMNFGEWQQKESNRLYGKMKELEILRDSMSSNGNDSFSSIENNKTTNNEDVEKPEEKSGRNFDIAPGFEEETAEEIGVDGWEHRITPFTSKEAEDSVIKHDDPDEDELINPMPVPRQPENMSRKINVISVDRIVRSYAQRMSQEEVSRLINAHQEGMSTGSIPKRLWNTFSAPFRRPEEFVKKSVVRAAEDGYRQAFELSIIERITENQNLMMEIEGSWRLSRPLQVTEGSRDVNYEILNEIISEHTANVQERTEVGEAISNPIVNARFQELITRYCLSNDMPKEHFEIILRDEVALMKEEGLISDESFLGSERAAHGERHEGFMYASNLFAVAEEYKDMVDARIDEIKKENNLRPEQEEAVRAHVQSTLELDIQLGSKMADLHNKQPLGRLNFIERGISFMQTNPILRKIPVNPGTLAIVGSFLGNVATRGVGGHVLRTGAGAAIGATVMAGALAPILGAALVGGTYAYFRRGKEVKQDSGMHKRDKALGRDFSGKGKREVYDKFQYDTRSASELMAELDILMAQGNYDALSDIERGQLADIFSRFKVELDREHEYSVNGGENKTVDLISVDEAEGDKYGTNIMSKTELKKNLWEYLRSNGLISGEGRGVENAGFEALVADSYAQFENNINQADAELASYRRRSSLTSAAFSSAAAAVTGIGFQEAWAHISEQINGNPSFTALDAIFHPEKLNAVFSEINGVKLTPGAHDVLLKDSFGKDQAVKLFVGNDGVIDPNKSIIPKDWLHDFAGGKIIAPGHEEIHDISKDLSAIGKEIGVADRKISYHGFYDQYTSPIRGTRGLVETVQNLAHNLGLKSNKTELLMAFTASENGSVELDLTKFVGKTLRGSGLNETEITQLIKRGGVKLNFAFDNSIGGTQNHPLSIDINGLKTKLPDNVAEIFTEVKDGTVRTKGLITLTIDDGVGKNGSTEVVSLASSFKEYDGSKIIKTITDDVSYDIKSGRPMNMPPVYGVGPTSRQALEGRTYDEKKPNDGLDRQNNISKRNDDNSIDENAAGLISINNDFGEDEVQIMPERDELAVSDDKNKIVNEVVSNNNESYLSVEEKELNDEFDDITDEVYGLRGEGQRHSLNHLYETARKLETSFGVGLMEKIQVELDKLDGKAFLAEIDKPEEEIKSVSPEPEVEMLKVNEKSDDETRLLKDIRELSDTTLQLSGIKLPREEDDVFIEKAREVMAKYKRTTPDAKTGDVIGEFEKNKNEYNVTVDNVYSVIYYLALSHQRLKEIEVAAMTDDRLKIEKNRIGHRRNDLLKRIRTLVAMMPKDGKMAVMRKEKPVKPQPTKKAQVEITPVLKSDKAIESGDGDLNGLFAGMSKLETDGNRLEFRNKVSAATELLAGETIGKFGLKMDADSAEIKKVVNEFIDLKFDFHYPLEGDDEIKREAYAKKAIYFYALQEERLRYAEFKLGIADDAKEIKRLKSEKAMITKRMKALVLKIEKAIKSLA